MTSVTLDEVRSKVDHVVVLMLENRSFDHLFGFLGLAGVEPPVGAELANPVDLTNPGGGSVAPSPEATHLIGLDPPHSHAGAKQQMGIPRRGRFPMNGFVDAYRMKLLNREHLPTIHWRRVRILAVGASPLLASATSVLVWRVRAWEWSGFAPWTGAAAAALALVAAARPITRAADIAAWKVALAVGAGAVLAASAIDGLVRFARRPGWLALPLCAGSAALALAGVRRLVASDAERRRPVEGRAAAQAVERAREIMWCMPAERVPVLGMLARQFATCARWFSSVPGATWPNRNFVHAGTSSQSVDIEVGFYQDKTLFELLDDQRERDGPFSGLTTPPWKIYRDGLPQVMAFDNLWQPHLKDRWRDIEDFSQDCSTGALPTYAFVEPRHSGGRTNSLHPGNNSHTTDGSTDFARGEQLVRHIYHAMRDGRPGLFERSVLVVTFDEHGGFFDRESPPKTRHPTRGAAVRHPLISTRRLVGWFVEHRNAPFDFRRLGVRVPTVIISPLVEPGVDRRDYDHTSVIATVRELFAPDQPSLGARARSANTFWHLVSRTTPRQMPAIPEPDVRGPDVREPDVDGPDVDGPEIDEPRAAPTMAPEPEPEPAPARPTPGRRARQDDDIAYQLETLADRADAMLDARGAPTLRGADAALLTERVDARLARWANDGRGA